MSAERAFWETARTISHEEAEAVADRFIAGNFRNAGHEYPRISIPANPDRDDDLLLLSYIRQQKRDALSPDPTEQEDGR